MSNSVGRFGALKSQGSLCKLSRGISSHKACQLINSALNGKKTIITMDTKLQCSRTNGLIEKIALHAKEMACVKEIACCVRGHVYKDIWAAAIGEVLVCRRSQPTSEKFSL